MAIFKMVEESSATGKVKEVFEDIKFIFRVCPTTEVAGDGVFDDLGSIEDKIKYNYLSLFYHIDPFFL